VPVPDPLEEQQKCMNKIQKILFVASALVLAGTPAFAQTALSTSTAPTFIEGLVTDVALIMGTVIVVIVGLLAALLGLGWGIRKFKGYVTGRKF